MAYEKYLAYKNRQKIALKYDAGKNRCVVGGFGRDRETITNICMFSFKCIRPAVTTMEKNKMRNVFFCSVMTFSRGLKDLKDQGFILEQVSSHGRTMR